MTLLGILAGIALILTHTMFTSKQPMMGFACAMFWALTGAQAYILSTTPWGDIYYYLAFGSFLGMTVFTALAAFGLREKRDTLAEEGMDEESSREGEEPKYFDEGNKDKLNSVFDFENKSKPSRRTRELRERAKLRRRKE